MDNIKIIRENSKIGKIFITPVSCNDLATGVEDEQAI